MQPPGECCCGLLRTQRTYCSLHLHVHARFVMSVVSHHWTASNKANADFLVKYPYAASVRNLIEHIAGDLPARGRTLVMDSYFSSAALFRGLRLMGCDAVGTIKFPQSGVPKSLCWMKKDRRGKPGDCRHLTSVDNTLGVQQWRGLCTHCLRPIFLAVTSS